MAGDPQTLPSSSEQVIMDVKSSDTNTFFNNLSGVSIIVEWGKHNSLSGVSIIFFSMI